jgi:lipopolysaccharide/colanic/teichoic acid biosynthesis glycosyltransferase
MLLIAIIIKITSEGPILYKGKRVGRDRKTFKILKFRTMIPDAEKLGGSVTSADDLRLTKLGFFLKKYKLDELPQLINILKGEMSFVGPRPEVREYIDAIAERERGIILSIRPGLTDLATLWNFSEEERLRGALNPEKMYAEQIRPEKTKLQLEYIKKRSFVLDLKIILKTILKLFKI